MCAPRGNPKHKKYKKGIKLMERSGLYVWAAWYEIDYYEKFDYHLVNP
jgi:hypothetical protein